MKEIPYTTSTGVQIGLRHNESPKPMPIDDPDMIYDSTLVYLPTRVASSA
jgi:hypothetical protein